MGSGVQKNTFTQSTSNHKFKESSEQFLSPINYIKNFRATTPNYSHSSDETPRKFDSIQSSPSHFKKSHHQAFSDKIIEFNQKLLVKLAILGVRPAVGKSTLISTFINQNIGTTKQTIGSEVSFLNYLLTNNQKIKIQFWEFESNEQNTTLWEQQINNSFDQLVLVFDEFNQNNAEQVKLRIQKCQSIINALNMNGQIKISLLGNDRLDMTITGKEKEIEYSLKKIYDGNEIEVKIINFKDIRDINAFFETLIQKIIIGKQ